MPPSIMPLGSGGHGGTPKEDDELSGANGCFFMFLALIFLFIIAFTIWRVSKN
jgi:hypothetical protein